MKQPLVSVVIPNYNYARYLPQAVNSVLAQTYPRIEIIVVDDGSTDDSVAKLNEYGDRIRYIRQQNKGVAAARNQGVQESKGELIAFLDADDYWLPMKIERQVAQFISKPDLGLVHCGVTEFDEVTGEENHRLNGLDGWVADELLLLQRPVILGGGSGLMTTRTAFDESGGFDTRLSTSADWDFFYRIASQYRVGFVPDSLVRYRMHGSNMHGNIAAMERDMLLGFHKAFKDASVETRNLRHRAYAKLHLILAGSYYRAGYPVSFMRHMLQSLWYRPDSATYLLSFPVRRRQCHLSCAKES